MFFLKVQPTKANKFLIKSLTRILLVSFFCLILGLLPTNSTAATTANPNLRNFGYYSVDADQNNNNITQIKALKNSNVVLVNYNPATAINLLTKASNANLKVIFHVSPYLLSYTANQPTTLRSDYLTLIANMQSQLQAQTTKIQSFYFDEPIWQGVSKTDFRTVTAALRTSFPTIGIMAVEAVAPLRINIPYTSPYGISNVYIDSAYYEFTTDLGFDYFVYSCQSLDYSHQTLLNTLSTVGSQKLWLVPDASINLSCTNSAVNLNGALNYYLNIANTNSRVVGMLPWSYTSYLSNQTIEQIGYIGTKEIFNSASPYYNLNLRQEHINIGKLVTI
jgi:hypothetical protein